MTTEEILNSEDFKIVLNPGEEYWKKILAKGNATEGWSFCNSDYETWTTTYEKFWFFFAVHPETHDPVASVCLGLSKSLAGSNSEEDLYAVGWYYCQPEYRGMGLGQILFKKIMDIAGDKNMVLHGVLKMAPRYASVYGFDVLAPHKHIFASMKTADVKPVTASEQFSMKSLGDVNVAEICAYDRTICPRERGDFIQKFISDKNAFTKVAKDSENKIVGFCCLRITVEGNIFTGPFYADSQEVALELLYSTLQSIPSLQTHDSIGFLYPGNNSSAQKMISELSDGKASFTPFTQLQFTKKYIDSPDQKVYSVSECAGNFV